MPNVLVVDPLAVRGWQKTFKKQLITNSVWEQLSNRSVSTQEIPNADKKMVPETVMHYVQSTFREGAQFVSIPYMDKLTQEGVGGNEAAQGTEEKPNLRMALAYYNVRRKAITFRNQSVDGDMTKAYNMLEQKVPLLSTYFSELRDLDKHEALNVGGDRYLTMDRFWTGENVTSAPVKKALHVNVHYPGQTSLVTWSATAATYMDNLITALNTAFTDATTKMTRATLVNMIDYASNNILPVKGKGYKWVILLSSQQALQLREDTSASGWLQTYREAGERGDSNKAITGILGIFQETLIIQNPRAPLLNCLSTFTGNWYDRFQYIKPWADDRTRVTKTTNDGTCEVAYILGAGAIAGAEIEDLKYYSEDFDYKFGTGFLGQEKCGNVRMDIYDPQYFSNGVSSEKPRNESSALYFTPSPTATY